jgi:hypothetical protein
MQRQILLQLLPDRTPWGLNCPVAIWSHRKTAIGAYFGSGQATPQERSLSPIWVRSAGRSVPGCTSPSPQDLAWDGASDWPRQWAEVRRGWGECKQPNNSPAGEGPGDRHQLAPGKGLADAAQLQSRWPVECSPVEENPCTFHQLCWTVAASQGCQATPARPAWPLYMPSWLTAEPFHRCLCGSWSPRGAQRRGTCDRYKGAIKGHQGPGEATFSVFLLLWGPYIPLRGACRPG